uniref:Uncharacterized protein n=1 Tax=Syphacia muris TaxID=451379 RepID=A0A0N5AI11_9BILA
MGYKKANEKLLRLSNHSRINSSTIKLASTTSYPTAATITDGNLFNIFCSTINRLPFYSKMGNCFTADYGEYNNGCMQMRDNVPLPTCDMISVMEKTRPPSIRRMKHRLLPFYFIPMFTSANDYRTPNTIGVYNRWRTIM